MLVRRQELCCRPVERHARQVTAQVQEAEQGRHRTERGGQGGGRRRDGHQPARAQPDRRQSRARPVPGSVRATATAKDTAAASGAAHQASQGGGAGRVGVAQGVAQGAQQQEARARRGHRDQQAAQVDGEVGGAGQAESEHAARPSVPGVPAAPVATVVGERRQVHGPYPASVEEGDRAVRQGGGLRVVRGEQDGDAVRAGRRGERPQDVGAVGAVQGGRRLVGEQDRRGDGEGAGDADALPLGLPEFVRATACLAADVEPVQPLQGGGLGPAPADAAQHQGKRGVLPGVQLRDERRGGVDPAGSGAGSRSRAIGPMVCTGALLNHTSPRRAGASPERRRSRVVLPLPAGRSRRGSRPRARRGRRRRAGEPSRWVKCRARAQSTSLSRGLHGRTPRI
ncbi:hypothetical protein SALBM311S_01106 [Streptomyces alboniger]